MIFVFRIDIKIIHRRRSVDKIIQIHRRHGFGEIVQKIKNTVGDMVFGEKTEEGSDAAELIINDQN